MAPDRPPGRVGACVDGEGRQQTQEYPVAPVLHVTNEDHRRKEQAKVKIGTGEHAERLPWPEEVEMADSGHGEQARSDGPSRREPGALPNSPALARLMVVRSPASQLHWASRAQSSRRWGGAGHPGNGLELLRVEW